MLDTISKKELEKYLGVTRKFHQASIVHGIHLLRIMKYDRQVRKLYQLCQPNNKLLNIFVLLTVKYLIIVIVMSLETIRKIDHR